MKYGVICSKNSKNIGDDIQTYAAIKLLPKVDYFIERETICDFITDNHEPVAVIMNAWWLWKKWNWPPSKYIIPKLTSMHFTDWMSNNWGSSIKYEMLDGIGKDYLNSYGPVGARDIDTMNMLESKGIKSYFSGCLTLTLPKIKKSKLKYKYIYLVDVSDEIIDYVKSHAIDKNIKLEVICHDIIKDNDILTWQQRMNNVEKLLKKYNNAFLVITSRLHATLPCLAMDTPVVLVRNDMENNRFKPYTDLCNCLSVDEFLNSKYDILNPTKNSDKYLEIRNNLIKEIKDFVEETKRNDSKEINDLIKTNYSDKDVKIWQFNLMKYSLDKWFYQSRDMLSEYNKTIDYLRKVEKENNDIKNSTSWKITKPIRMIKDAINRIKKK